MITHGQTESPTDSPLPDLASRPYFELEDSKKLTHREVVSSSDERPGPRRAVPARSQWPGAPSALLAADRVSDLSSHDVVVREAAWAIFYPRARVIAASKLRNHYGLRARIDDQDVDETIDASMVVLYRRCVQAPTDNPVRQPYALLVSICVHILPKAWKKRKRERDAVASIALSFPEYTLPGSLDEFDPNAHSHSSGIARWILLQLDKGHDKMPKEIKAGLLGSLFRTAGLGDLLDEALDRFPEARQRHCRLYHDEGFSTTEIAQRCGCGPSNISNNLRRSWLAFQSCDAFRRGLEEVASGRQEPLGRALDSALMSTSLDREGRL